MTKLFCNHEASVFPIRDPSGWVVGEMCDKCKKVWIRKGIPNYDNRLKSMMGLKIKC